MISITKNLVIVFSSILLFFSIFFSPAISTFASQEGNINLNQKQKMSNIEKATQKIKLTPGAISKQNCQQNLQLVKDIRDAYQNDLIAFNQITEQYNNILIEYQRLAIIYNQTQKARYQRINQNYPFRIQRLSSYLTESLTELNKISNLTCPKDHNIINATQDKYIDRTERYVWLQIKFLVAVSDLEFSYNVLLNFGEV
jgi:hypothetical protein